jgi:hypothetical protein
VCSLAQHLIGKYAVPAFLTASWYATDDAYAEKKREWFVAHARGASFRSLDLPIEMTRKMEHIFLTSRDHLAIEQAMRRAELLALGASDELVQAVLATGSATDLRNGAFWRAVWMFLIANASAIDLAQVGPMLDFVQAIRHERVAVETPDGIVLRDPPQPSFSLNGRTMQSMLRLMQEWHRSLGLANGGLTWAPSPLQPMLIEEPSQDPSAPPSVWQLMELTNGTQLRTEGTALHHCVASYADRCWRGASRIWSLRVQRGEKVRHVLTIEVDMKKARCRPGAMLGQSCSVRKAASVAAGVDDAGEAAAGDLSESINNIPSHNWWRIWCYLRAVVRSILDANDGHVGHGSLFG